MADLKTKMTEIAVGCVIKAGETEDEFGVEL